MSNPYLKTNKPKANSPVEILVILDKSGSMQSIIHDAIGGFNRFLKAQQDLPGEATISLVFFDNQYETPVVNAPLSDLLPLNGDTYSPRGATALYDAIGRSVSALKNRNPDRAVICIVTDGEENASKEWDHHKIKTLLESCTAKGYEVVYLAANVDVAKNANLMGVSLQNARNFAFSGAGVAQAYNMATASVSSYRGGGSAAFDAQTASQDDSVKLSTTNGATP